MRRATAAFLGTVAGTSLLVGAKIATASPEATTNTSVGAPIGDPAGGDGAGTGASPSAATSGPAASRAAKASAKAGASRPAGTTSTRPAATATTRTAAPSPTRAAACTTATGSAASVSSPGVGSVTVTVKVCDGSISTSSGYLSRSNWDKNSSAIPALNSLAVRYGKTSISKVYYSGCSLTSAAYRSSLSSALSKAG